MKATWKYIKYTTFACILLALAGTFFYLRHSNSQGGWATFSAGFQQEIDATPIEVKSMQRIRQWEFLSIENEELIDTTRTHWWKEDDRLVRIYRGTLRLGINMEKCQKGWAMAKGDTAYITLPAIELLDRHFIDDAKTRSFHQQGKWEPQDYQDMYLRAEQRMTERSLTEQHIKRAEENARQQMGNLFRTLGYAHVKVTVSPSP